MFFFAHCRTFPVYAQRIFQRTANRVNVDFPHTPRQLADAFPVRQWNNKNVLLSLEKLDNFAQCFALESICGEIKFVDISGFWHVNSCLRLDSVVIMNLVDFVYTEAKKLPFLLSNKFGDCSTKFTGYLKKLNCSLFANFAETLTVFDDIIWVLISFFGRDSDFITAASADNRIFHLKKKSFKLMMMINVDDFKICVK